MKTLALVTLLAAPLAAQQITSTTVNIGSPDAQSCQNGSGRLTGGVAADGDIEYRYDQATARLTLVVSNHSPIVAGEENPQITRIYFNAPPTVTGMRLISQTAGGPVQPTMVFSFDSGGRVACLGNFRGQLDTVRGNRGAIANDQAPLLGGSNPVIGPVTFEFDVIGNGLGTLVADSFAYAFGTGSNLEPASATLKFQVAGVNGQESGFLGNGGDCLISFYTSDEPRIGTTIDFCQSGPVGCHDCMWLSLTPGPVTVGGLTLPIGLPLLWGFDFGEFGADQRFCQSLPIPNDPLLVGTTLYFAVGTFPASNRTNVSLSSAFELTITQ